MRAVIKESLVERRGDTSMWLGHHTRLSLLGMVMVNKLVL